VGWETGIEPATFGATDRVLVLAFNLSPYFSVVLEPNCWAKLGITGIVFEYVFEYAFECGYMLYPISSSLILPASCWFLCSASW
jgi:hypothetical protein